MPCPNPAWVSPLLQRTLRLGRMAAGAVTFWSCGYAGAHRPPWSEGMPIVRLGLKVCKNGIRNHASLTRAPFRFRKIFLEERAERVTVRHPEKRECGAQHVHIESIDIGAEVTLLLSSFQNAV